MQVPPDSLHSYDSTFFSVLNGRKEVFFNENSHLSPDERQERWNQFITNGQLPESINALPQSQPNNVQVEAPAVKRQRLVRATYRYMYDKLINGRVTGHPPRLKHGNP